MFGVEIRNALLVLVLAAAHIYGDSSPHQSHNVTTVIQHNSADTAKSSAAVDAPGSKRIQSVPSIVVDHHPHAETKLISATPDNFTDLVRLQDVLMVFDLHEIAAKWTKIQHEFKSDCRQSMTEYFRGLQQHKMWAIKSKSNFEHRSISFLIYISYALVFIANHVKKKNKNNYKHEPTNERTAEKSPVNETEMK